MSRNLPSRIRARALVLAVACVLIALAVRLAGPVWAYIPPESKPLEHGHRFAKEDLARGKLLVASELITGGPFARSVILLTDYGWNGAVGVIINRPTGASAASVLPNVKVLEKMDARVWFGGPVDTGQITMLVRSKEAPAASMRVFDDVYASTSVETLLSLVKGRGKGSFRLYAGYAGWAPQQLELEVIQGGWYVMDAAGDDVFGAGAEHVWLRLMERAGALSGH